MSVTYICERGHERDSHASQPQGHGQQPVCRECKADIIKRAAPKYECEKCNHVWYYTGDADRPTCPGCAGKNVTGAGD